MIKINKKFIFILLVSLICALVLGGNLPYAIFYTFVVTFIIEFLYIKRALKDLNILFRGKSHAYTVGEKDNIQLLIKNFGLPYIYLYNDNFKLFNKEYNGHCIYADSEQSSAIDTDLYFNTRGIYDLGNFHIKVYDLFNIFFINKEYCVKNQKIKIYPKIYHVKKKWALGEGISDSKKINKNLNEDISLLKDVRKYVVGDSLKRVHWKLSAKHRELYVKNFENTNGKFGNVFLDMSKMSFFNDYGREKEEKCIEMAVSLINNMNMDGVSSKIFINDKNQSKFQIYNPQSFGEFMEKMIIQKTDGEVEFSDFLRNSIKNITYGGLVYLITTEITEKLWNTICDMIDKKYQFVLLYSSIQPNNTKYIEALPQIGVEVIHIKNILF